MVDLEKFVLKIFIVKQFQFVKLRLDKFAHLLLNLENQLKNGLKRTKEKSEKGWFC